MAAGKCSAAHQFWRRDGGNRALKQGGRHMSFFLSRLNGRFFVIYRPAR
jgi:hypothetical protein